MARSRSSTRGHQTSIDAPFDSNPDDLTMSDTEASAMSAPEPVAAPAPAPAVSFDNAKVDELKSQATDKVQELYKKGKDKLDQVNCQPIPRSVVAVPARDPAREDANLKPDVISPHLPYFAVRPLRR